MIREGAGNVLIRKSGDLPVIGTGIISLNHEELVVRAQRRRSAMRTGNPPLVYLFFCILFIVSHLKEELIMKMRTLKKLMAGTLLSLFACGMAFASCAAEAATEEEILQEEDEEDYTTGDASLDDIRNQDEIGEKELLVVSFGTSFNDSRRNTIGAIEGALAEAFPAWSVRRAFTSQIIIDHVESRDGIHIDNVEEALERAVSNGVKTLLVQPTHLMNGYEYEELEEMLAGYADAFDYIGLGTNLLDTDEDFEAVARAITEETASYDDGETAIVFMGHGTEADSNAVYAKMQDVLTSDGFENYYIGTVEAVPSLDDVIEAIADKGYTKVVLEPLMVVAGDHANNDMAAADDPESWYSILTAEGYDVTCLLKGLGEIPAIRGIYTEHAQAMIDEALQQ